MSEVSEQLPYMGIRHDTGYRRCNLDCPYCICKDWKERNFDLITFRNVIDKIKQLPYKVCLRIDTEGEPFTSPEILQVIRTICNENNNIFGVSFSSNIHADWDKVIKPFIESTNTSKLGMGCTLHDMVIKDIALFFKKVKKLKESGVLLYVGYVAIPQRLSFLKEYKQRCEEIGVPFIINALIGRLTGIKGADTKKLYPFDYTFEERERLCEYWDTPHSFKLLVEGCSTKKMICSAGKNYVFIDSNGDVYPCSKIKLSMGNLLHNNVSFNVEDTLCSVNTCWCGNENQALRIVDKYYTRTRTLRIFYPRKELSKDKLYEGYNSSTFNKKTLFLLKAMKLFPFQILDTVVFYVNDGTFCARLKRFFLTRITIYLRVIIRYVLESFNRRT